MSRHKPVVALQACDSYLTERLFPVLDQLLELLGGWSAFLDQGDRVLLKPNLVSAGTVEEAISTHPAIVEYCILSARSFAAEVTVGDSPAFGSAQGVAQRCGILEVCQRHQVPVIDFARNASRLSIPSARDRGWSITRDLERFDKVINLPKFKAHGQMRLTGATKNLFGCVAGKLKAVRHLRSRHDYDWFADMVLRTALRVSPAMSILDGVIAMDQHGPTAGRARPLGVVLASPDPVALDRVMTALVNLPPEVVPILAAAERLGLPGADLQQIQVVGSDLKSLQVDDFEHIDQLYDISFDPVRVVRSCCRHLWRKWRPAPSGRRGD